MISELELEEIVEMITARIGIIPRSSHRKGIRDYLERKLSSMNADFATRRVDGKLNLVMHNKDIGKINHTKYHNKEYRKGNHNFHGYHTAPVTGIVTFHMKFWILFRCHKP